MIENANLKKNCEKNGTYHNAFHSGHSVFMEYGITTIINIYQIKKYLLFEHNILVENEHFF